MDLLLFVAKRKQFKEMGEEWQNLDSFALRRKRPFFQHFFFRDKTVPRPPAVNKWTSTTASTSRIRASRSRSSSTARSRPTRSREPGGWKCVSDYLPRLAGRRARWAHEDARGPARSCSDHRQTDPVRPSFRAVSQIAPEASWNEPRNAGPGLDRRWERDCMPVNLFSQRP